MSRKAPRFAVILRDTNAVTPSTGALHSALVLAKSCKAHVTALVVFAPRHETSICQDALNLGCNEAIGIRAHVPLDFFGEALLLRPVIDKLNADLVLCGDDNVDHGGAALLGALGYMLDLDCVAGVTEVSYQAGDYLVTRRTDQGFDRIRCSPPSLLALGRTPSSVTKPRKVGSKRRPSIHAATNLLSDLSTLELRSPLAEHTAFAPSPESAELFSEASALLLTLREAKLWTTR